MDVRLIHNEEDLAWALSEIQAYFDDPPEPETAEADRFDRLATRIEAYENEHWPIAPSQCANT